MIKKSKEAVIIWSIVIFFAVISLALVLDQPSANEVVRTSDEVGLGYRYGVFGKIKSKVRLLRREPIGDGEKLFYEYSWEWKGQPVIQKRDCIIIAAPSWEKFVDCRKSITYEFSQNEEVVSEGDEYEIFEFGNYVTVYFDLNLTNNYCGIDDTGFAKRGKIMFSVVSDNVYNASGITFQYVHNRVLRNQFMNGFAIKTKLIPYESVGNKF